MTSSLLLAAFCSVVPALPSPPSDPAPFEGKLLVIDLDDVGFKLLEDAATPTLDFLRDNGRSYTSFMTSSLCSPTRAMFNVGAYPSHPDLQLGTIIPAASFFSMPIAPLVPLATLVADNGFSTAKIGKWHLAGTFFRDHPQDCGWQSYSGVVNNLNGAGRGYMRYLKNVNGELRSSSGIYITTDETNDAISCVNAGINLISLSYHAPHDPWHEPPAGLFPARPLNDRYDLATAMLEACDTEMGRLLSAAIPEGYTIIAFADNGTHQSLAGGKGTFNEDGIINPMFAYGPGVEPGIDDSRVAAYDLYPTIANLFGIAAGKGSGFPLRAPDGESFIESLRGAPIYRRFTYVDRFPLFTDPRNDPVNWRRAFRGERFKYTDRLAPFTGAVLWDYVADPAEEVNLFDRPLSTSAQTFVRFTRDFLSGL